MLICMPAWKRILPLLSRTFRPKSKFSLCRNFASETKTESSAKQTPSDFQFSKSEYYPQNTDLIKNICPNFVENPSRFRIWASRTSGISLCAVLLLALWMAFNSEYDLEVEEKLMETLPGYEESMKVNPKYTKSIENLRMKRENAKTED